LGIYIYEGLLELVPKITEDRRTFTFAETGESRGHARKTTGSYYTPDELVQLLIKSALEPVALRTIGAHPDRPAEALWIWPWISAVHHFISPPTIAPFHPTRR
jgi:hypothetical protein